MKRAILLIAMLTASAAPQPQLEEDRDPFQRFQTTTPAPGAPQVDDLDKPERIPLKITGLVGSEGEYTAISELDGKVLMLRLGDKIRGARVESIDAEGLTLVQDGDPMKIHTGETRWRLTFRYAWRYSLQRVE